MLIFFGSNAEHEFVLISKLYSSQPAYVIYFVPAFGQVLW